MKDKSAVPPIAAYIPPLLLRHILANPEPLAGPLAERLPAAVLFADISGFTHLAEALAQQGAGGAEELTLLLNRYFERVISLLEAEGGQVVKFSGDALTAIFPAQAEPISQAARRAWQAGAAVQAAMPEFAALETSLGPVSLGLRIGLGAGEVLALQVGGVLDRWEYFIAGDAVRQAAEAEERAGSGQVERSPEMAGLIHPDALPSQPAVSFDWSGVLNVEQIVHKLRLYVPSMVRTWIDEGLQEWLAVLRPMSVVFAGLGQLDYSDPRTVTRVHNFVRDTQEALQRYEGSLNKLAVDDKGAVLLALMGLSPCAHEDDPRRAIRCAFDLQRLASSHGLRLTIGITTGQVFAGPVGSASRREYTVIGDAVNLAARLMSRAEPDGILCDWNTYHQVPGLDFESLPPLLLKGKAAPVQIYRPSDTLQSSPAQSQPAQPGAFKTVGRQAEIARLNAALTGLEAGQSHTLIIEGEAGIGKSQLVGELIRLAQARGLAVLAGAGQSIERHSPYRAWRDILTAYFGLGDAGDPAERQRRVRESVHDLEPEHQTRLPLLGDILELGLAENEWTALLDASSRQQSLTLLILALMRAWASRRPLLLVLEDAHWLDSLSWELVVQVARGLAVSNDPLLLALATRPLDEHAPGRQPMATLAGLGMTEKLALTTLAPAETIALATTRLGLPPGALPEPVADLVRQRAGGNPFFAQELVYTLRDQEIIRVQAGRCLVGGDLAQAGLALPATVQGLILARIDRLPPERQLVLKMGAVIGRSFAYTPLHYLADRHTHIPDSMLREHLDALRVLDITPLETVEPDLVYSFKHIITQEVAYQTLLFAQRRELHRTVAQWYESTCQDKRSVEMPALALPLLVHHYRQAGDTQQECRYARLAGEQAAAQFANAEAVRFFSRALDLTPPDDIAGRYDLLLARADVYDLQGDHQALAADLAALAALAPQLSQAHQANSLLKQVRFASEYSSDPDGAIELARQALEVAERAQDAELVVKGRLAWSREAWKLGDMATAQEQAEQAIQLAQAAGLTHMLAPCLMRLGSALRERGDVTQYRACLDQALRLYRQSGDLRGQGHALNNIGDMALDKGEYSLAHSYFIQTLDIVTRVGDRNMLAMARLNLGHCESGQGDLCQSLADHRSSLDLYRETGNYQGQIWQLGNVGNTCFFLGHYEQVVPHFEQAVRLDHIIGNDVGEGVDLYFCGRAAAQLGNKTAAQEYYRNALDRLIHARQRPNLAGIAGLLGETLAALGRLAEAQEVFDREVAVLRAAGRPHLVLRFLGRLAQWRLDSGDVGAALAYVQDILPDLDRVGVDYYAGDPFFLYATCWHVLQAAGDDRARRVLELAYRLLHTVADRIEPEQDRRAFLENVPHHRAIRLAWQSLSAG